MRYCPFSGDKTLDGYQKKKYVCKLLFIFLLGHDIDFGHMEAVNLLSSNKYTEKQIVSILPELFNPLYSGGLFLCYMLDESICHCRGVRSSLSLLLYF